VTTTYDLAGKTAIITGGAGGIGLAIAEQFLMSGARLMLWDRSAEALDRARAALGAVETRVVDITDAEAGADQARFGRIDALVNNAGILGEVTPSWRADPAAFRSVVDVNLTGAFLCLRAVLPLMRAQAPAPHRGHVVSMASIQGKEGMALAGAYSASKAALIALTKSAAKEVAGEAILINAITPAAAETAMAKQISGERRADILGRIPMGRFVETAEIARMVAWLCSSDCSFSTGATFDLSGGRATY
jgi:NAD(P)-dependent dehydrogenase (short-subunit alcohol dehydrogenase family)